MAWGFNASCACAFFGFRAESLAGFGSLEEKLGKAFIRC